MMGFTVYNTKGESIAGSDAATLFFYRKGVLVVPRESWNQSSPMSGITGALIPTDIPERSLIFYKCAYPILERGGRVYPIRPESGYWPTSVPRTEIEYFVFSPPTSSSLNTFGLEVFDEGGVMAYSSHKPTLKIIKSLSYNDERAGYESRLYVPYDFTINTGVTGSNMAICLGNLKLYWTSVQYSGGFTDVMRLMRGLHLNSNGVLTLKTQWTFRGRYSGSQGNYNLCVNANSPNTLLVADVTGL